MGIAYASINNIEELRENKPLARDLFNSIDEQINNETLVGNLSDFLAEPFGITDLRTIRRIRKANSYFDIFVHYLDDVKDNKTEGAEFAHEAVTNLIKGIRYVRCVNQKDVLFDRLFGYWQQASKGEKHLWKHHGAITPYNSKDFLMLGKRGSMAKIPIALYADASKNHTPVLSLERGIENAGLAVQLCDDIFDWEEDMDAEIYTHPIALAFQKSQTLNKKQVESALFSTEIFSKLANKANYHLALAEKDLKQVSANKLANYINKMKISLVDLNSYLKKLETRGIKDNLDQKIRERADPLLLCH